ncbi:uncharacterized protein LOC123016446 isoform X1 [Tribolium madens]|uniref:uncharacterized protein LOC123016446 isoform X1 n=2 Tax=Tribolium madens TaxID=41895 RepID=UPI001CF71E8E|nr:uncharacterized protein LOC123016446 isoform X1 [Tribolium madens]XP_044272784.1 uncharacterized protein LOC123016446 isoform X1 [Tribolium madens]XP_044272785.1 uncharacterized protein LOC123016446 isoform X1 [Tribolium madens]
MRGIGVSDIVVVLLLHFSGILCNIDRLELIMPRYAIRGGDVILKCEHSVPPEQLYKVEWQKGGHKIFQYIKGRKPPFRFFPTAGAVLNKANTSEMQIQLSKLDFSASGSYSCLVSMETPIFTKDSKSKDLTVIEPQDSDPTITFNKSTYEIGEVLEANCTTASARPPPHITWLINGEKVPDALTKRFSNGIVHGHGYFDQKASSTKQLSIEVSDLHVGDDGELRLTCMSTIPGYINPNEVFADERKTSVRIEIEMTEGPVEAISNNNISSSCPLRMSSYSFEIINVFFIALYYHL